MILEKIKKPNDIHKIPLEDFEPLAAEIRDFLIRSVSQTGGHLASNLGVVELTLALHNVLDFPEDKLIWDVGHQAYTHKILTGRKDEFKNLRQEGGLSGFPKRSVSPCDAYDAGHSSNSISAGLGYVHARDILGQKHHVVSVIGDGALTGGMAYEALNNAAELKTNFIIIINDNNMSISRNVGGMSTYLSALRTAEAYTGMKMGVTKALKKVPKVGTALVDTMRKTKSSVKQLFIPGMLFENMGLTYLGPVDGHNMRQMMKNKLIDFVRSEFRDKWIKNQGDPSRVVSIIERINPNALLIGFARRFATYKRAHLLFTDLDRLSKIVNNPQYPVQFIFSGKAHPADGAGQDLIKRIVEISRRPEFLGKIIFLENYDMKVAKRLVSGVDIWLNTPTRPLEASGTSGEKAEMNGVLNFSVLDGWWYEGYKEGAGWALTDKRTFQEQGNQDQLDAATIYAMLENQIVPLYFAKNSKGYSPEWIQYIKNSIAQIAPEFTMKRMLEDYIERFYSKEAKRSKLLVADNYKKAKEIAAWKQMVVDKWDEIEIKEINLPEDLLYKSCAGETYDISVTIDRKGLPDCLGVELVVSQVIDGQQQPYVVTEMNQVKTDGDLVTYALSYDVNVGGIFKYAFRLFPKNPDLPHRQDFSYVRWF